MRITRITHILMITLIAFSIILFASSSILNAAVFNDNFDDGNDDGWTAAKGTWAVENYEYSGSTAQGEVAVSIVDSSVTAANITLYADLASQPDSAWKYGFIVFYQRDINAKFSGSLNKLPRTIKRVYKPI